MKLSWVCVCVYVCGKKWGGGRGRGEWGVGDDVKGLL